jgi:hypothetical protein
LAAAWLPSSRAGVEVRICRSLDEAVPSPARAVLLVFFSTDCPLCYNDLFEARYAIDQGRWPVSVIGVFSGLEDDLHSFLEKHAWTAPVVLDRRKVLARKFKVDIVPYKVLLAGGRVVYRDDPYADFGRRLEELKSCARKVFSR